MRSRSERHPAWLAWYAAGRLDPAANETIDRHLRGCEACRAEVSALRSVYRSVRAASPVDHISPALLVAYHAGGQQVPDSERRSMRAHIEVCHTCAADLLILQRAEASERRRRSPAALGAVASLVIVATAGWKLAGWHTALPVSQELAVVFTPQQRGEPSEKVLAGTGPWLVQTWLPGRASAQIYRARIRRADDPSRLLPDQLVAPAPLAQFLVVRIPDGLAPGRYQLSLIPQGADGSEDAVYGFRVVGRR